jgi:hypothetical protein
MYRDGKYFQVQYSTNQQINSLYPSNTRIPILRSSELDDNRDGIMDRLELSVLLPLLPGESILSFSSILYEDIQLRDRAKILIDGITYLNYESAVPMASLTMDGDLLLRQSQPFSAYGG